MLFASSASNDCECTNTLAHNTLARTYSRNMKSELSNKLLISTLHPENRCSRRLLLLGPLAHKQLQLAYDPVERERMQLLLRPRC